MDDDYSPRRSGSGGRFIGALLLALVAFGMYISQIEQNPITGERQHVAISPDQEIRLGLTSAPEMARQMGGEVPDSDARTQEVQKMGARVAATLDAQKSPWKFQYHLLADSETINAFALPGGQVFITLGLLNKLQTEAQLAGVLGHETGHVIERHTAEQMAKSQLGKMLVTAVGVGASDSSYGGNSAMMAASVVNQMFQLRYSRKDELEADGWGVRLMEKLGYTPEAMVEVLQILKAADKNRGHSLEMLQTHPDPDARIEQIQDYLRKNPPPPNLKNGRNLRDIFNQSP